MKRFALCVAVAITAWAGGLEFLALCSRVRTLERQPRADPKDVRDLRSELRALDDNFSVALEHVTRKTDVDKLAGRIRDLEGIVCEEQQVLYDQDFRLETWERSWAGRDPDQLDLRLGQLGSALEEQRSSLVRVAREAEEQASAGTREIDRLKRLLPQFRDNDDMWNDLLGPTVQLSGENTVGTGILLPSRLVPGIDSHETYVLTAWHVVRDMYSSPGSHGLPVPVRIYDRDGEASTEEASLIAHEPGLDVALLLLASTRAFAHGTALASRERLLSVRVFDPIYAVGCPLGNDPIPTHGEIAATHHSVDGQTYWMISAPTYIGNSGGGVFDARTHELLGVFSKIYTHGSMRATIVPHMGLVTPLTRIYDWLEQIGHVHLAEPVNAAETQVAAAPQE